TRTNAREFWPCAKIVIQLAPETINLCKEIVFLRRSRAAINIKAFVTRGTSAIVAGKRAWIIYRAGPRCGALATKLFFEDSLVTFRDADAKQPLNATSTTYLGFAIQLSI